MENKKISELTALAAANITPDDVLPIVNAGETKKVSTKNLAEFVNGLTFKRVDVPKSQILNMYTSPIELLPVLDNEHYYDIERIILEYQHKSVAYSASADLLIGGLGLDGFDSYVWISPTILTQGVNVACVIHPNVHEGSASSSYAGNTLGTNNVTFTSFSNPTGGDGKMVVKIWYSIRTFD